MLRELSRGLVGVVYRPRVCVRVPDDSFDVAMATGMGMRMKFGNFADGVALLAKYQTDRDEHCVSACHDQLFVCSDALPLSDEDKAEMERLGWFVDEESWSCFT